MGSVSHMASVGNHGCSFFPFPNHCFSYQVSYSSPPRLCCGLLHYRNPCRHQVCVLFSVLHLLSSSLWNVPCTEVQRTVFNKLNCDPLSFLIALCGIALHVTLACCIDPFINNKRQNSSSILDFTIVQIKHLDHSILGMAHWLVSNKVMFPAQPLWWIMLPVGPGCLICSWISSNTAVSRLGYDGKLKSVSAYDSRFRLVQMTKVIALLFKGTDICLFFSEVIRNFFRRSAK